MAISPTDRNESLQCVACAVRQQRGQAITERDLANAILDWDNDSLEYSIVNSIGITVEMENEIKSWTKKWELGERNNKQQKKREYDNWIKSSILVANNLANSKYIDKDGYTFFRQDSFPDYKDKAYSFAKQILHNTKNSVMKATYGASVGSGWKDKWNPSDILAIKTSSVSSVRSKLRDFDAAKYSKDTKKLRKMNIENRKLRMKGIAKKQLIVMEEMDSLYEYSKFIDDLCDVLKQDNISFDRLRFIDACND